VDQLRAAFGGGNAGEEVDIIVLTFNPDRLEDYKSDPGISQTDPTVLFVTGFELPVMFMVNGIDLFEITSKQTVMVSNTESHSLEPVMKSVTSSWLSLPILNFALHGLEAAKQVYRGKPINLELQEGGALLHFRAINNNVEIYSDLNKKTANGDPLELLKAFETFLDQIRYALRTEVPNLLEHPYWDEWLKEPYSPKNNPQA
jgi:hypothetical protein